MTKAQIFFDSMTKDIFSNVTGNDYYKKHDFDDCVIADNAFILPTKKIVDNDGVISFEGGVVDAEMKFIQNSQFLRANKGGCLLKSYEFSQTEAEYIDEEVLYAGVLINHFGHFLVEGLSRIWYWCEHADKNLHVAFLMPKNQPLFPQFWEFMDLIGIDKEKVHIIKKITKFKKVYIPYQSHILATSYNEKFTIPYKYISSKIPAKKKEKYYISRSKFKGGTLCLGEYLFENLYKQNGYKIIHPEKLSLKEQISVMKNASELAGISGTGMHMVLFADDNIDITILERTDTPVPEQSLINQAMNANTYYVGVNTNPFPVDHSVGPTLLTINEAMASYCKTKQLKYNKSLVNYVKTSDGKKFVKLWLKYYSQSDNNNALAVNYPLTAKRFMLIADAFIPLKKLIKQKIKSYKKRK
ncbi:MAG: glycosyltransferase family 61 protein [Alphaproteobacteria bacterium]|nr:glycosyltransferase family 61 protein [Alphaproteobacteria bacterium]